MVWHFDVTVAGCVEATCVAAREQVRQEMNIQNCNLGMSQSHFLSRDK